VARALVAAHAARLLAVVSSWGGAQQTTAPRRTPATGLRQRAGLASIKR